jgi:hypothetical protein
MRVNDDGRTVAAMDVLGGGDRQDQLYPRATALHFPSAARIVVGRSLGISRTSPHDLRVSQFTLTFRQKM